jgi:hypothetical protein
MTPSPVSAAERGLVRMPQRQVLRIGHPNEPHSPLSPPSRFTVDAGYIVTGSAETRRIAAGTGSKLATNIRHLLLLAGMRPVLWESRLVRNSQKGEYRQSDSMDIPQAESSPLPPKKWKIAVHRCRC